MEGISLSEFKQECEEFHILEKSVRPKRIGVEVALEVMREEIIEKPGPVCPCRMIPLKTSVLSRLE